MVSIFYTAVAKYNKKYINYAENAYKISFIKIVSVEEINNEDYYKTMYFRPTPLQISIYNVGLSLNVPCFRKTKVVLL